MYCDETRWRRAAAATRPSNQLILESFHAASIVDTGEMQQAALGSVSERTVKPQEGRTDKIELDATVSKPRSHGSQHLAHIVAMEFIPHIVKAPPQQGKSTVKAHTAWSSFRMPSGGLRRTVLSFQRCGARGRPISEEHPGGDVGRSTGISVRMKPEASQIACPAFHVAPTVDLDARRRVVLRDLA